MINFFKEQYFPNDAERFARSRRCDNHILYTNHRLRAEIYRLLKLSQFMT